MSWMTFRLPLLATSVVAALSLSAYAVTHQSTSAAKGTSMAEPAMTSGVSLEMPKMDPARGRKLFASKGCVVCHSINGVGGEDAPALDASTMQPKMNPFEFAAKMWRGAPAMIAMQREELGEQIELTGGELADIVAFAHNAAEQKKFSEADIPENVRELMAHEEEHEDEGSHAHMTEQKN